MKKAFKYCFIGFLLLAGPMACASRQPAPEAAEQSQRPDNPFADLAQYINSFQAHEMLASEPLHSRIKRLLSVDNRYAQFLESRAQEEQITQIKEGYILSPGHNLAQQTGSLVLIDIDRQILAIATYDKVARRHIVSMSHPDELSEQVAQELKDYARRWARGQLGISEIQAP